MLLHTKLPFRYVLKQLSYKLPILVLIAGGISYFDQYFEEWGVVFPIIPEFIPGMLGTIITLVLAFRMSQSYERWWEARKIWGAIVNDSRTLYRDLSFLTVARDERGKQRHKQFRDSGIKGHVNWLRALRNNLRTNAEKLQYPFSISHNLSDSNEANGILYKQGELVHNAHVSGLINDYQQVQLNNTLSSLTNSMGKAERIKKTVFPQFYSNVIEYAIWLFVIILPLAFRDPNEYVEFPVVVIISSIFLLLEKLAISLQNPFENEETDTPIDSIINGLEKHAVKILQETTPNVEIETIDFEKSFYVM